MGNRFLKRREEGGRALERQNTWRDASQKFCELYVIWRDKSEDGETDRVI